MIGRRGRQLAVGPVERERLEGMRVDALDVAELHEQLPERGVLARQLVGEIGVGHQGQQVVPHAVVPADLLLEQGVHRLPPTCELGTEGW